MDQSVQISAEPGRPRRWWGAVAAAVVVGLTVAGCGAAPDPSRAPLHPSAKRPVEVGGTPVAVAVAAGAVWVADNAGGRVIRLDARTGRPSGRPIPVGAGPEAITAGEGAVWVAGANHTVTRVDPRTGRARRARVHVADPAGIAAGEGSVWVASQADGTVTRIDPKTLQAVDEPIAVGGEPGDIAIGDGAAWVASAADGTVTRIDASSGEQGKPIEVADQQVLGLSFGEGGVWVAKTDDRLARTIEVTRIDPRSSEVQAGAAEVRAAIPVQLAAGDGGVWVTLVGGVRPPDLAPLPGEVALVDPSTVEARATPLRVGERPSGIAAGEGGVWVADAGDGTVTRIDPGSH
jgi:virginiamycin B lyase